LKKYSYDLISPAAEVLVPLFDFDLFELYISMERGNVGSFPISLKTKWATGVVVSSKGHRDTQSIGKRIKGIEGASKVDGVFIFHEGTRKEGRMFFTNGEKVLCVVGIGQNPRSAREKAYRAIEKIKFDGMHYRRDIAHDA